MLLFICGIVAARHPLPGLTAFALILWVDSRSRRPAVLATALLFAALGWGLGRHAEPETTPTPPPWLLENLATRKAVRVSGTVISVSGLPDQRLRLVLENVQPLAGGPPLPGGLAWTWDQPPEAFARPLPGQRLTASLRIRPVRGFRNEGLWNSEDYWHRRAVFFQSWSRGEDSAAVYGNEGKPKFGVASREGLRRAVVAVFAPAAVLAPAPAPGPAPASGPDPASGPKPDPAPDPGPDPAPDPGPGPGPETALPTSAAAESSLAEQSEAVPDPRKPAPGWTLLPALLFGDRFELLTPDVERLASAGLAHSMALSGQHLAVVGLLALGITAAIGQLKPELFLRLPAAKIAALCSLPPAALYLWLGDVPPSLVRAALMLAFWTFFLCANRAAAFPDALLAALGCMALVSPLSLYEISVQLSFTAVAGIALFAPLLRQSWKGLSPVKGPVHEPVQEVAKPVLRRGFSLLSRCLWLTFGCSLAVQLATYPLVMSTFGRCSWWFPLNLLWLPVLGLFVLPLAFLGLAALCAGLPSCAALLLQSASLPCDLLLQGLALLEKDWGMSATWGLRPHWTASLGLGAVLVALALLQGRLSRQSLRCAWAELEAQPSSWLRLPRFAVRHAFGRLVLAGIPLLLIGPFLRFAAEHDPALTLRVLDVGQAQAVLLEWPDPELGRRGRALVDGGGFFSDRFDSGRDIIAPILTANRSAELDFIALSHPDRDHLRGLLFLAEAFAMEAAYTSALPAPNTAEKGKAPERRVPASRRQDDRLLYGRFLHILAERDIPHRRLTAGDRVPLGPDTYLEVLAPFPDEPARGNNGLVLRLSKGGKGLALLPGDAEAAYLRRVLARHSAEALRAEVLVLPHHGSASSLLPAFYDAVRPTQLVVSSGAYNAYRLPAPKVLEEAAQRGLPLHNTADSGEFVRAWLSETAP